VTRASVGVLFVCATALAAPPLGSSLASVEIEDSDGGHRTLPDHARAIAVIYEDQDAAKRPQPARELFGTYTRRPSNRVVFEFVAVADVSKWNWWPAKKYVFADVKKIATRNNTRVYLDWKGALGRSWGLKKGMSGVLLVGADGRVRFAAEGPLSADQARELKAQLTALGARSETE
jgi:hypothetical protein